MNILFDALHFHLAVFWRLMKIFLLSNVLQQWNRLSCDVAEKYHYSIQQRLQDGL